MKIRIQYDDGHSYTLNKITYHEVKEDYLHILTKKKRYIINLRNVIYCEVS